MATLYSFAKILFLQMYFGLEGMFFLLLLKSIPTNIIQILFFSFSFDENICQLFDWNQINDKSMECVCVGNIWNHDSNDWYSKNNFSFGISWIFFLKWIIKIKLFRIFRSFSIISIEIIMIYYQITIIHYEKWKKKLIKIWMEL